MGILLAYTNKLMQGENLVGPGKTHQGGSKPHVRRGNSTAERIGLKPIAIAGPVILVAQGKQLSESALSNIHPIPDMAESESSGWNMRDSVPSVHDA